MINYLITHLLFQPNMGNDSDTERILVEKLASMRTTCNDQPVSSEGTEFLFKNTTGKHQISFLFNNTSGQQLIMSEDLFEGCFTCLIDYSGLISFLLFVFFQVQLRTKNIMLHLKGVNMLHLCGNQSRTSCGIFKTYGSLFYALLFLFLFLSSFPFLLFSKFNNRVSLCWEEKKMFIPKFLVVASQRKVKVLQCPLPILQLDMLANLRVKFFVKINPRLSSFKDVNLESNMKPKMICLPLGNEEHFGTEDG